MLLCKRLEPMLQKASSSPVDDSCRWRHCYPCVSKAPENMRNRDGAGAVQRYWLILKMQCLRIVRTVRVKTREHVRSGKQIWKPTGKITKTRLKTDKVKKKEEEVIHRKEAGTRGTHTTMSWQTKRGAHALEYTRLGRFKRCFEIKQEINLNSKVLTFW